MRSGLTQWLVVLASADARAQASDRSFLVKGAGLQAREAGLVAASEGRFADAVPLLRRAVEGSPPTGTAGQRAAAARTENALGGALKATRRSEEAAEAFGRALQLLRGGETAHSAAAIAEMAVVQSNVGAALAEAGRASEAESFYRAALQLVDDSGGGGRRARDRRRKPVHEASGCASHEVACIRARAEILNNLADLRHGSGRLEEAYAMHHEALQLRDRGLGDDGGELAGSLNNVAVLLMDMRRHEEALPMLRRAAKISRQDAGEAHPQRATALSNLAGALRALQRPQEALPHLQSAVAINTQALGEEHASTVAVKASLRECASDIESRDPDGRHERRRAHKPSKPKRSKRKK